MILSNASLRDEWKKWIKEAIDDSQLKTEFIQKLDQQLSTQIASNGYTVTEDQKPTETISKEDFQNSINELKEGLQKSLESSKESNTKEETKTESSETTNTSNTTSEADKEKTEQLNTIVGLITDIKNGQEGELKTNTPDQNLNEINQLLIDQQTKYDQKTDALLEKLDSIDNLHDLIEEKNDKIVEFVNEKSDKIEEFISNRTETELPEKDVVKIGVEHVDGNKDLEKTNESLMALSEKISQNTTKLDEIAKEKVEKDQKTKEPEKPQNIVNQNKDVKSEYLNTNIKNDTKPLEETKKQVIPSKEETKKPIIPPKEVDEAKKPEVPLKEETKKPVSINNDTKETKPLEETKKQDSTSKEAPKTSNKDEEVPKTEKVKEPPKSRIRKERTNKLIGPSIGSSSRGASSDVKKPLKKEIKKDLTNKNRKVSQSGSVSKPEKVKSGTIVAGQAMTSAIRTSAKPKKGSALGLNKDQKTIIGKNTKTGLKPNDAKALNGPMIATKSNDKLLSGINNETGKTNKTLGAIAGSLTGFLAVYKKVSKEQADRELYKLRFGQDKEKKEEKQPIFKFSFGKGKDSSKQKKDSGQSGSKGGFFSSLLGMGGMLLGFGKNLLNLSKGARFVAKFLPKGNVLRKGVAGALKFGRKLMGSKAGKALKFVGNIGKKFGGKALMKGAGKVLGKVAGPVASVAGLALGAWRGFTASKKEDSDYAKKLGKENKVWGAVKTAINPVRQGRILASFGRNLWGLGKDLFGNRKKQQQLKAQQQKLDNSTIARMKKAGMSKADIAAFQKLAGDDSAAAMKAKHALRTKMFAKEKADRAAAQKKQPEQKKDAPKPTPTTKTPVKMEDKGALALKKAGLKVGPNGKIDMSAMTGETQKKASVPKVVPPKKDIKPSTTQTSKKPITAQIKQKPVATKVQDTKTKVAPKVNKAIPQKPVQPKKPEAGKNVVKFTQAGATKAKVDNKKVVPQVKPQPKKSVKGKLIKGGMAVAKAGGLLGGLLSGAKKIAGAMPIVKAGKWLGNKISSGFKSGKIQGGTKKALSFLNPFKTGKAIRSGLGKLKNSTLGKTAISGAKKIAGAMPIVKAGKWLGNKISSGFKSGKIQKGLKTGLSYLNPVKNGQRLGKLIKSGKIQKGLKTGLSYLNPVKTRKALGNLTKKFASSPLGKKTISTAKNLFNKAPAVKAGKWLGNKIKTGWKSGAIQKGTKKALSYLNPIKAGKAIGSGFKKLKNSAIGKKMIAGGKNFLKASPLIGGSMLLGKKLKDGFKSGKIQGGLKNALKSFTKIGTKSNGAGKLQEKLRGMSQEKRQALIEKAKAKFGKASPITKALQDATSKLKAKAPIKAAAKVKTEPTKKPEVKTTSSSEKLKEKMTATANLKVSSEKLKASKDNIKSIKTSLKEKSKVEKAKAKKESDNFLLQNLPKIIHVGVASYFNNHAFKLNQKTGELEMLPAGPTDRATKL